jgi:ribosomal protein S27E
MSLPDTAEYWQDVNRPSNKHVFTHIKGKDCGHFHVTESKELSEIDCHACKKIIENDAELKSQFEKNNGKRYNDHRKKKGFKLLSTIKFGKYKCQTLQWIIDNDINYFNWVKDKLLFHPEVDALMETKT